MSEWENKWMEWVEVNFYIWYEKWPFPRTQDPLAINLGLDKLCISFLVQPVSSFQFSLEVKKVKKEKKKKIK